MKKEKKHNEQKEKIKQFIADEESQCFVTFRNSTSDDLTIMCVKDSAKKVMRLLSKL